MNRRITYSSLLSLLVGLSGIAVLAQTPARVAPAASATKASASGTPAKAPAASSSSAIPAASAAPAGFAAAPSAAAPASSGSVLRAPVAIRREVVKPPAPTPAQVNALEKLDAEMRIYSEGAGAFQRSLTMIVRHHYEERRRRILAALDREIGTEQKQLATARDEAIRRFEDFIARYGGANADPSATPDAMFRLAALYEERARGGTEGDPGAQLDPAIALYRRIIREFPSYEELAAVHYYLGHGLTDAGRLEEGQQAWRALVCANRYKVLDGSKDPQKLELAPLDQDHDGRFWDQWFNKNTLPVDQLLGKKGSGARATDPAEELAFRDPYAACAALPQKTLPGDEPRYLAEVWWQLGNFHFDQLDTAGGPFSLNRAVSAYSIGMQYKKPPLYGVSMYKLAWTYYKQQRYKTTTESFVKLLGYADELEAKTGDPGADFRQEAFTYIAGSLTYFDFDGPGAGDPYVPRNDVLDVESNPVVAEQKMGIAIQRIQDPALIPQDRKWTVEIYKALAQEYTDISQHRNAITTMELTLQKFPLDRDAPVIEHKVAELYDQLARLAPEGSAARAELSAKALAARGHLAAYVGATAWTDANKDDPEALQQAEQLVRSGLKRAAADHTNYARAYYNRALELNDAKEQRELIEKSVAEYRLADQGWSAFLEQDPTAMDAYETRFWIADARYWVAVLQIAVERTPSADEVRYAREAATLVRDSNEDDKYLQPAAYYVVTLAEKVLEDQYRLFQQTTGAQGIEQRSEVPFEGEGETRKVKPLDVPIPLTNAVQARDEYNARVPLDQDPQKNGLLYSFQSADYFFVYGQFPEAKARFTPIFEQYCGKNEWGYKAWEKLISVSTLSGNIEESRHLAETKSCAYNEDTKRAEDALRKPVKQGVAYLDARKLYDEAEKMPPGPERDKKWREAAASYKVALEAAPDRDEAPEAAMNGAYAYKQVGEYDKAIEMYEVFIKRYGNEVSLKKLREGDPKGKPPVEANPKKYEERVKYLKGAYDALGAAYILFFDYPRAAETYEKIAQTENFPQAERRDAAKQALVLYTSLNDRGGMTRTRDRYRALGASPKELAEADFVVATADFKRWDEFSPDEGANQEARKRAQKAMGDYYDAEKNHDGSSQYVVQAAYNVAKMKRASGGYDTNDWWKNSIAAFKRHKNGAPTKDGRNSALGTAEASMAAEAEYTLLDQEIGKKFDYETGHHRYKGTSVEVISAYRKDAIEAKAWFDKLQSVVDGYLSPEWTPIAVARQGSLYDSLRTGLYNTRPPALKMYDKKLEDLLKQAEESGIPELQEKADAKRVAIQEAWRNARDQELDSADRILVDRYGNAVVLAKRFNVSNPAVTRAIRRLAFVTDVVGEAKMKTYASAVKDLGYTEGMFQRMRPGLVTTPKPEGMPRPLPVIVQGGK